MKTIRFLYITLLTLICGVANAQNGELLTFKIDKEELGKTLRTEVYFDNEHSNNFTAFQMDIIVPEEFDYMEFSLEPGIRMTGHMVSVAKQTGNVLRVTAFSPQNQEITGKNGKLFSITLAANKKAQRANYQMNFANAVFTKRDGNEFNIDFTPSRFYFVPFADLKPYELVYMVDGKVYKEMTLMEGETIPPVEAPTKEGYTFKGWRHLPKNMPSRDLTTSALFSANYYTITYYLDGVLYDTQKVRFNTAIKPLKVTPEEGLTFMGWEGLPEKMPAHDLTVYGKTVITGIENECATTIVDVYNLQGIKVLDNVSLQEARQRLPRGLYIVNGKPLYIK